MSVLACLVFAFTLGPLGVAMCWVTWPMTREHAGMAHRVLGRVVSAVGALLAAGGVVFLFMAAKDLTA